MHSQAMFHVALATELHQWLMMMMMMMFLYLLRLLIVVVDKTLIIAASSVSSWPAKSLTNIDGLIFYCFWNNCIGGLDVIF